MVCDPIEERLDIARTLGAQHTASREADLDSLHGDGFDAVVETAGVPETVPFAVRQARPGGRVVLTGIPMDAAPLETRWIVWRELEVHGSFIYAAADFAGAATRIQDGSVRVLDLVTHRFPFEHVADAFGLIGRRGGLKALIKIQQEDG